MKASHLQKQSEVIENIYKDISEANANGRRKHFIPHWVYVSEAVKLQLLEDGYTLWDGLMNNGLIIEW